MQADEKCTSYVMVLGHAIKAERRKRKLTQTQLALLSNCNINFVSQVESGKISAQIGKVLNLLSVLGLELHVTKGSRGVVDHVKSY
jgi:HTH-type transcriptional regulator/antitoxin HipB